MAASGPTSNDEAERYARFERLQQRMPGVWDAMARDLEGESVVVLPSMSIDLAGELGAAVTQAYEERLLFLLLLLRQPRLRMVYVTSLPVAPAIVEYYLGAAARASSRATRGPGSPGRRATTPPALAQREAPRAAPAASPDRGD